MALEALGPDEIKFITEHLAAGEEFADILELLVDVDSSVLEGLSEEDFLLPALALRATKSQGPEYYAGLWAEAAVPAIDAVNPSEGWTATNVYITGEGFAPGATVTVGGHACKVINIAETIIWVQVPAHAAEAELDVVVTNENTNGDTASAAFSYVDPDA